LFERKIFVKNKARFCTFPNQYKYYITNMTQEGGFFGLFYKVKNLLASTTKKYGKLCLINYLALYVVVFSTIYYLVKTDVLSSPVDPNKYLKNFWLKKRFLGENDLPEWSIDLATSWLINKATEPVRILVVVALTPMIARMLPDGLRTFLIGKEEEEKKGAEVVKTVQSSGSREKKADEAKASTLHGAARKRQNAK